jgi:hypothetical protein
MVIGFNTAVMSRSVLGSASKSGNRTSHSSNKQTGVCIGVYLLKTAITPVKSVLVDPWGKCERPLNAIRTEQTQPYGADPNLFLKNLEAVIDDDRLLAETKRISGEA